MVRENDLTLDEPLYRVILDSVPSGRVFVVDRGLRVIAAGGSTSLTGAPVKDLTGKCAEDLLSPDEMARLEPALRAALAGKAVHREGRLRGVDVEYWLQPLRDDQQEVTAVVATVQNVTERMRAERELREERERLVRVLDGSSDGYGEFDLERRTCEVSPRWNEILGRDPGLRTMTEDELMSLVHPDDRVVLQPALEGVLQGREARFDEEHRLLRADGSWAWLRTRAKVVARDGTGRPLRLAGTISDITSHRNQANERRAALMASEARYRSLYESMMDGFVRVGMDGVIRETNEAYRQMLGYGPGELERLTYGEITPERWHAEEARLVREQVLPRGYSDVYEKEYRRQDGSVFPVELRTFLLREGGEPVGMWAIVRDVSARNHLRDQLSVATRLAALGTLVASVAHEINNPLAAVLACEGFAMEAIEDLLAEIHAPRPLVTGELSGRLIEVMDALRDAQGEGERIARIVKGMAAFASPEAPRGRSTLAEAVDHALRLLPASTRGRVRIRVEDAGNVEVAAPVGLLAQVLVSLVSNSADAMPPDRQGNVTIRIGQGAPGRAFLDVVDDGVGMTPEVMARVFDPFFSTRLSRHGAGLGLSVAHSVVKAMGGTITACSEPGKGAAFRVEIPEASASPVEGTGVAPTST